MNSLFGRELTSAKSLLYILLGIFLWGHKIDVMGNPGNLEIKIASRSHDLYESFSAEVWVYPGNSDIQSVSLYISYDSSSLSLQQWEVDPHNLVDLTLIESHDEAKALIAFEGGFLQAKTDSLHLLSIHFQAGKVTDSSFITFSFDDEGPSTEVLNSASRSIIQAGDFEPVLLRVVCPEEAAYAGTDQALCDNVTQLKARIPDQGEGFWTILEGEGGYFTDSSNPTTFFTGRKEARYTLEWKVRSNTCAKSTDTLHVSFMPPPPSSEAGEDQIVFGDLTYLDATPSSFFTSGHWRILSEDSEANLRDPENPKSAFIGEVGEKYLLEWTEAHEICTPQPDTVEIHFRRTPIAFAGEDQEIRNQNISHLKANLPDADLVGVWSIISGGYGSISNKYAPGATFRGRLGYTYKLQWTLRYERTILDQDTVEISFLSVLSENPRNGKVGNNGGPVLPPMSRDSLSSPFILPDLPSDFWSLLPRKNVFQGPIDSDVFKDSLYFQPEYEERRWRNISESTINSDFQAGNRVNRIDFFPNPVLKRQLSAYISGEISDDINYKILNINGQELLQGVWETIGLHQISLDNFNPGIYTLSAVGRDGTKFIEKIYVK